MKLFDIYEYVALSPCATAAFPYVLSNNMRVIVDMYWPLLDLEPQWTFNVGYYFIVDALAYNYVSGSANSVYSFTAGLNYRSNVDYTDLVVTAKEGTQSQRGKNTNIGKPIGNCMLILDRNGLNSEHYPISKAVFSGNSYNSECEYVYSTNYEDIYPGIIDTPTYDQNGVWIWYGGISPIHSNSMIEITNNVSMSSVNCGKVKIYSISIQRYDESTGAWGLVNTYSPCIYNDGSQNGVLGFVDRTRTMFSSIYDVPNTCSSYVENQLPPGPEDEFEELFPNAKIASTNTPRYNNGESPIEAFRAFKTLEALQAFINAGRVYIGELVSIVDDSSNTGVYQIVYGANDALTYRKLKFN